MHLGIVQTLKPIIFPYNLKVKFPPNQLIRMSLWNPILCALFSSYFILFYFFFVFFLGPYPINIEYCVKWYGKKYLTASNPLTNDRGGTTTKNVCYHHLRWVRRNCERKRRIFILMIYDIWEEWNTNIQVCGVTLTWNATWHGIKGVPKQMCYVNGIGSTNTKQRVQCRNWIILSRQRQRRWRRRRHNNAWESMAENKVANN